MNKVCSTMIIDSIRLSFSATRSQFVSEANINIVLHNITVSRVSV